MMRPLDRVMPTPMPKDIEQVTPEDQMRELLTGFREGSVRQIERMSDMARNLNEEADEYAMRSQRARELAGEYIMAVRSIERYVESGSKAAEGMMMEHRANTAGPEPDDGDFNDESPARSVRVRGL